MQFVLSDDDNMVAWFKRKSKNKLKGAQLTVDEIAVTYVIFFFAVVKTSPSFSLKVKIFG